MKLPPRVPLVLTAAILAAVAAVAGVAGVVALTGRGGHGGAPTARSATARPVAPASTAAPAAPQGAGSGLTIRSVRSGPWSDPATWGGHPPGTSDRVAVTAGTTVTHDRASTRVAAVQVQPGGTLVFDPDRSTTLECSGNVVVDGALVLRPAGPQVLQTLRFVGVDEARFVGGGMKVLPSDVGLWVMGAGRLDAQGARKGGWVNAAGGIAQGATRVPLAAAPAGWQVGDQVSIAPTEKPAGNDHHDPAFNDFDERTITAVRGASITLDAGVSHPHPMVNRGWTAEVLNLTRTVRIEGTPSGHAHVFIHSSVRQTVDHVAIRYMGPRNHPDGHGVTQPVAGRYGLHFHLTGDADRGVTVEGVVVSDTPNHAFVPHASNGITFRDDISYNTTEDAYWWDQHPANGKTPPQPLDFYETTGTRYDHDIAAKLYAIPETEGFDQAGFNLSGGADNRITRSVVVGNLGGTSASGFAWPEGSNDQPNIWGFADNLAHNNAEDGIFVWQNTQYGPHLTDGFVAYRNGHCGIKHGAYENAYVYRNPVLFENAACGILTDAQSGPDVPITFDHPTIVGGVNAVLDTDHNGNPPEGTVVLRDCTIRGQSGPKVEVDTSLDPQRLAFVRCGVQPGDIHITKAVPGDLISSQPGDGGAFQVDHTGTVRPVGRLDAGAAAGRLDADRPPQVTLTSPAPGARIDFAGDVGSATFSATASDPDGHVQAVLFFVEGRRVAVDTTSPYQVTADVRSDLNGVDLVSAIAVDDQGIASASQPVTVLVNAGARAP